MPSERIGLTARQAAPAEGAAEYEDWPLLFETLARFEDRDILPANVFKALPDELKGTAGRLARVWNTRFTAEIYEELFRALREGKTVRDFADDAQKILDKYGAAEGLQVYTGDRFSPAYADTVFRTNTQAAQAAGHYAEMFHPDWMEAEPYWQFSAIDDSRTRPEHAALDGKVFRKDDPEARKYLPPIGFNCRCQAIPLTDEDIQRDGLEVASGASIKDLPLEDADGNPILGKDGKPLTVGRPPKGWDADRVESLVPGTLKGGAPRAIPSTFSAPAAPAVAPERPPARPEKPTEPDPGTPPAPPPWHEKFPPVITHVNSTAELTTAGLKPGERLRGGMSPLYERAKKKGDEESARQIANLLVKEDKFKALKERYPSAVVVPVQAVEGQGNNRLPKALAKRIAEGSSWSVSDDIVQTQKVSHTGADAITRMVTHPVFDGPVVPGQVYIIVDDVTTSGSSLAALRHYIASKGGRVVRATSFAAVDFEGTGAKGAILALGRDTAARLAKKFDLGRLDAILSKYGIVPSHEHLTDSEGRTVLSYPNLEAYEAKVKQKLAKLAEMKK